MDIFFKHINLNNECKIFSSSNEIFSYKNLLANAVQASHFFKSNNITSIIFCTKNSYNFLYSFLGVLHAGVCVTILHSDYPYETLISVAIRLNVDLIIYDDYSNVGIPSGNFKFSTMLQLSSKIESINSNYLLKN